MALRDVSLRIERGEKVGVIGSNGAGKSTLMRLMAGILRPDVGRCDMEGMSATLLSLNAGFDPELSGRRNIVTHGILMGLSKRRAEARVAAVAEASGLGAALERRVSTYSNGMRARLCFWTAIDLKPDLMLVDEVLAVGDSEFRERSRQALVELMQGAGAVVLVSHNLGFVTGLCERVLWLDHGRVRLDGEGAAVAAAYEAESARAAMPNPGTRTTAFVCGVPGGGAETVARLLNTHPQVCLGNERYTEAFLSGETVDAAGWWSKERFFGDAASPDAAAVKLDAATVVGDKIEELYRSLDALDAALPESKLVFVLRDPALALWSCLLAEDRRDGSPAGAPEGEVEALLAERLAAWNDAVAAAMAAAKTFRQRLLLVSYDRLFGRQRAAVLAGLFRFLDLPMVAGSEANALIRAAAAEARAAPAVPGGTRRWVERRAELRRYERLLYSAA